MIAQQIMYSFCVVRFVLFSIRCCRICPDGCYVGEGWAIATRRFDRDSISKQVVTNDLHVNVPVHALTIGY
jgi:hypothetical protein